MTLAGGFQTGHPTAAHRLAGYRSEFPIFRDRIYLNTCSLGALGERARRKATPFLDAWDARGAAAWYDVWWAALAELRDRYARVIGATAEEIALAPSISVALSAVAEALDYTRRPKVVVTSLDFPTVAYQWLAKRARGVELLVVESPDHVSVPVEATRRPGDARTAPTPPGASRSARRRSPRSTHSWAASTTSRKSASPRFGTRPPRSPKI